MAIVDTMLADIVSSLALQEEAIAIDSPGVESSSVSAYFQARSGRKLRRYVKLPVDPPPIVEPAIG